MTLHKNDRPNGQALSEWWNLIRGVGIRFYYPVVVFLLGQATVSIDGCVVICRHKTGTGKTCVCWHVCHCYFHFWILTQVVELDVGPLYSNQNFMIWSSLLRRACDWTHHHWISGRLPSGWGSLGRDTSNIWLLSQGCLCCLHYLPVAGNVISSSTYCHQPYDDVEIVSVGLTFPYSSQT